VINFINIEANLIFSPKQKRLKILFSQKNDDPRLSDDLNLRVIISSMVFVTDLTTYKSEHKLGDSECSAGMVLNGSTFHPN
jgi:hypothetical protein